MKKKDEDDDEGYISKNNSGSLFYMGDFGHYAKRKMKWRNRHQKKSLTSSKPRKFTVKLFPPDQVESLTGTPHEGCTELAWVCGFCIFLMCCRYHVSAGAYMVCSG